MSQLDSFCSEFGLSESDLGLVRRIGRECFLIREGDEALITKDVMSLGIYLGEEKTKFKPSPALLELIAGQIKGHKVVVNDKAEWLFLCGRDILNEGIVKSDKPTVNGLFMVQNEFDENLGYGCLKKGMAVKNLMDRGFYLRRER